MTYHEYFKAKPGGVGKTDALKAALRQIELKTEPHKTEPHKTEPHKTEPHCTCPTLVMMNRGCQCPHHVPYRKRTRGY